MSKKHTRYFWITFLYHAEDEDTTVNEVSMTKEERHPSKNEIIEKISNLRSGVVPEKISIMGIIEFKGKDDFEQFMGAKLEETPATA